MSNTQFPISNIRDQSDDIRNEETDSVSTDEEAKELEKMCAMDFEERRQYSAFCSSAEKHMENIENMTRNERRNYRRNYRENYTWFYESSKRDKEHFAEKTREAEEYILQRNTEHLAESSLGTVNFRNYKRNFRDNYTWAYESLKRDQDHFVERSKEAEEYMRQQNTEHLAESTLGIVNSRILTAGTQSNMSIPVNLFQYFGSLFPWARLLPFLSFQDLCVMLKSVSKVMIVLIYQNIDDKSLKAIGVEILSNSAKLFIEEHGTNFCSILEEPNIFDIAILGDFVDSVFCCEFIKIERMTFRYYYRMQKDIADGSLYTLLRMVNYKQPYVKYEKNMFKNIY
jgi:hypothetical protein